MDRDDENLKNAIKEGEIYRYFEWQITVLTILLRHQALKAKNMP